MSGIDELIAKLCPEGVTFRPLGDCWIKNAGGGTPSKAVTRYWNGSIPWASVGDLSIPEAVIRETRNHITEEGLVNSTSNVVRAGDIIVAVKIAPGRMKVAGLDIAINQDLRGLTLANWLHVKFLLYFFQTLKIVGTGTIVRAITVAELGRIRIPVPPLEVQREIVRILDYFTELEAELEARRAQYDHYRLALLSFPRTTRRVLLEDVVFFTNAKAHERFVDPAGDVALLTARFVSTQGRSARFVNSKDVLTPALQHDVALVMSDLPNGRALAKAFFVPESGKYAANQRVCLLRVKDERVVLPRFLYYLIDRNKQLLAYDSGVDQTHLKKSYILEVQLALPDLAEQIRIASILDAFEALVNDLSVGLPAELAARRKQYENYRDRLLTFDELPA